MEHLLTVFFNYSYYIIAVLIAVIILVLFIRFLKFRISTKAGAPDMDFSFMFPKMNLKTFLPESISPAQDETYLKECCLNKKTYIGWYKTKGVFGYKSVPISVNDKERTYHSQVVGTTGAGKTETLFNFIAQDIIKGYGCCIIDPKADDDFLEKIMGIVKKCGREKDVYFFSLMYPHKSHIYNPVQFGTPAEITERIINSANIENEYYKNTQFTFLLNTINVLREVRTFITLNDIVDFLKNFKDSDWVKTNITDLTNKDLSPFLRETSKRKNEDVSGILAILMQVSGEQFGKILNGNSIINIKEIINKGKIVLFQIPVMKYATIGKALGKMILQDIQSVVGGRQSTNVDPDFKTKNFYPLYVDEFYSMAYPAFVELINKARSAAIAIHLGHQSLADLSQVSKEFKEAVFENTNIKIISKQNDAASCEEFAKSFGTFKTVKETHAVQKGLLFNMSTNSSLREVDEFLIHPNLIKTAKVGQGVVKLRSEQAVVCQYRMFHRGFEQAKDPLSIIPERTNAL